jgi:cellulose synthase/poly-beta-1,6-N-acetylglucosamine synthase-like glycosyltransferase
MNLSIAIDSILVPLAYLAVLPYFGFMLLTSLSAILRGRDAVDDRGPVGPVEAPERRFLIVIPAHDEQAGVAEAVRSCRAIDYPARLFDVLVIADNCTDRTAAIAGKAGARVVERTDDARLYRPGLIGHTG